LITLIDGQRLTSSLIISIQNFFPLSDCKIDDDDLINKNKLNKKAATSIALLDVRGFAHKN